MNPSNPHEPRLPREAIETVAAAWLSLRDRGMSAAETAEFMAWLQEDAHHATVFAELDRVWKDFDRLGAVPAPVASGAAPDADLLAPRIRRRTHHSLRWIALGATAAAMVFVLAILSSRKPRHSFETAVGAFQKVDLPDGSVAQLNTDSAINIDFSAAERRVRVVRGEVFFDIAKDPARPFVATSGPVAVRAVGTAFNVRRLETAVEVLVTEGQVRMHDLRKGTSLLPSATHEADSGLLVAGERATVAVFGAPDPVAATATVEKLAGLAAQRALAWQERRLEFDAVSLGEVAREFNRYNRRQIIITEPALAARRFSGTFRADGYEAFVRLLEKDFGVKVTNHANEIVLHGGR